MNVFYIRSYRLKNKRPLGQLLVKDRGCDSNAPGIGDIAFVKNLRTEKIVTMAFQCSVFGLPQSSTVGWVGYIIIYFICTCKVNYNLNY